MSGANWTDRVAAWGAVKKINWKNLLIPLLAAMVLVVLVFLRMTDKPSADKVAAKTAEQTADLTGRAVTDALTQAGVLAPAVTQPAAPPNYDYITCTHLPPKDIACVPLFLQPLTTEAKHLIGYQGGIVGGALNSDNTRAIVNQIRLLTGVGPCDLYLGLVQDENKLLRHKVFASQAEATTGHVKLYDCTPLSNETTVTAPTSGAS